MDDIGEKDTIQDGTVFDRCPNPIKGVLINIRQKLGDTKLGVHVLVCIFAISAWANLNGIWSELSLLVPEAPEGWDLPSYIIIISQFANIGPLIFVLVAVFAPNTKPKLEKYTSFVIIMTGVFACFMLAFFWKHTGYLGGKKHSTAFFILEFIFALGDCTSSVSFYAFMSSLKSKYMASLFLGEGLSGMLPAFIALGQGVGDITCVNKSHTHTNTSYHNGTEYNTTTYHMAPEFGAARFSVKVYFIIIALMMAVSACAFVLINTLSYCKTEMVDSESADLKDIVSSQTSVDTTNNKNSESPFRDVKSQVVKSNIKELLRIPTSLPGWYFTSYMVIILIINMTRTSFLATIQTYSTIPYGLDAYHLATNLSKITNPVACFFALFIMTSNLTIISVIFFLGEVGVAVITYIAAKSPDSPLYDEASGAFLIIFLWVVMTFLLTYAKVCVAGIMRRNGRYALIWTGVITQVGALIGAIVGFLVTSQYKEFKSAPYCR